MGISSVSSGSSIYSLLGVNSTYSDEASLLSTKISDLQARIKALAESGESSTTDSSTTDSSAKSTSTATQAQAAAEAVASARAAKAAAASTDEEEDTTSTDEEDEDSTDTLEELKAQLVQYQVRQAQVQGLQVGDSMEQQFSSLSKYNSMASLTGQVLDITA